MNITPIERRALYFIYQSGGGLPGGRQNTRTTNRLLAKGMVRWTDRANRVEVTAKGLDALSTEAS